MKYLTAFIAIIILEFLLYSNGSKTTASDIVNYLAIVCVLIMVAKWLRKAQQIRAKGETS